jgi:iron complex outermembrane receptor protein
MRTILLALWMSFSLGALFGQSGSLTGKVTDEQGIALPGATIELTGDEAMAITDAHGIFHFDGCSEQCFGLKVSYLGFETAQIHLEEPLGEEPVVIVLHPSVEKLDEVIIRDNYSETRKNESSLNVEIVNDDFIARNLGGSLMKSLERLPGVSSMEIGAGQSKPVIRGLSFNRVVVVENGIKHEGQQWGADHGLEIDQFSVEHLEVIKGPASLLYGSDAIGGIIDIRAGKPPHKNSVEGNIQGIYRSNNQFWGTSGRLSARKTNWFFDSRLTLVNFADYRVPADTVSIYSYRVALPDQRLRNTAGRENALKLDAGYLSDRFNSVFYLSRLENTGGLFANAHGLEPRLVNTDLHDRSFRDIQYPRQHVAHWKAINRTALELSGGRMEIEMGFQRNDRAEYNDYINHGYMPEYLPEGIDFADNLERGFLKDIYSFHLQTEHLLGNHGLQVRANAEYQDNRINGYGFIIPAFHQWTGGFALYDKWALDDQWMFHAGLRYDYGRIDVGEYYDWFPTPTTNGQEFLLRAEPINRVFHNPSWGIGMNYNREHFHVKLNAGKSFRMPIAKELAANGVNYHHFAYERGNPELDAETAYQLDGVIEWHHEKWAFQLGGFTSYFPNYIYLNPTSLIDLYYGAGNQIFEYQQSEVWRIGGELHAHINLTKALKFGIIGEYIYSEQLSGAKKGFTLPFSPPPAATFSIQFQPEWHAKRWENAFAILDVKRVGAQNNIVPPEQKTPGYSVLNLNTGISWKAENREIKLNISVHNVLNTKYLNHTSFYRIIEVPEAGRNVSVSLKIPFHTGLQGL